MTQEEIIDLQKELLKVKLLLQKCNGDIVRADRELKSERNKTIDDCIRVLNNYIEFGYVEGQSFIIKAQLESLKVDL